MRVILYIERIFEQQLTFLGDFSKLGTKKEVRKFNNWLKRQNFAHKIVIAGNHEFTFDLEKEAEFKAGLKHYAQFVIYKNKFSCF